MPSVMVAILLPLRRARRSVLREPDDPEQVFLSLAVYADSLGFGTKDLHLGDKSINRRMLQEKAVVMAQFA